MPAFISDAARALADDLIGPDKDNPLRPAALELLEEALVGVRSEALLEMAEWHESRAALIEHMPSMKGAHGKEMARERAMENRFAATYLSNLPDVERTLDAPSKVGSDSARTAWRLLYEGAVGETNEEFMQRAIPLLEALINASVERGKRAGGNLEDNLPADWRLEKLEIFGTGEEKYKITLWKRGGNFLTATGRTSWAARDKAIRQITEKEHKHSNEEAQ